MTQSEIGSRIIDIESKITSEVRNGHKPHIYDKFREERGELVELRCKYFGEELEICKRYRITSK